jgi:daunosaminyl-N,N-dimethyltransferase/N-dimethyltransferase
MATEQYSSLARYYDAMYHWKDYAADSEAVRELLATHGIHRGARILEAACGTGGHMVHLRRYFDVSGFDIAEPMIEIARSKLPDVPLWCADLRSFAVDATCDAAICLFSSIGYLRTVAELESSAACFARAVRPGGVVLIEPWFTASQWDVGRPTLQAYQGDDVKLARATVAARDGDVAIMDMHWLVLERGQPVRHVVDRHEMWLCPHELLESTFAGAGFGVTWSDALERRVLVGIRQSQV